MLQSQSGSFGAVTGAKLGEDVADVYSHGSRAEGQLFGNLFVRQTDGQQRENLSLSLCQVMSQGWGPVDRLDQELHGIRVYCRTAQVRSPDCIREFVGDSPF